MKTIATASLAMLLSACAATTPQQARELGPERRYVFQAKGDYQTVYRKIVETSRACYQAGMIGASMIVDADLYPDTRKGTVTVGLYGGLGPSLYQVIDVRGIGDELTEVTAAFPMGPVARQGDKLRARVEGTSNEC